MTKLWCITYEHIDGGCSNLFTVGVDMDAETADMLVLDRFKEYMDDDDITLENCEVGEIFWEEVPSEVDGFNVILEEI